MELVLLAVPILPAAAAAAIATLRPPGPVAGRWASRAAGAAAALAVALVVAVAVGGPVQAVVERPGGQAVAGLHADRVGAVLAVLTSGLGLVVLSFARRALEGDPRARRFAALGALLTAATTTVATAATATGLAAAWIVAGVAVAALVAHRDGWAPARSAARRARGTLLAGDAALVAAVAVAVVAVGDLDLRAPGAAARALATARLGVPGLGEVAVLPVVAVLLVAAGVSRSALVPLHRWLPATVAAPTPVSALLHAGVVNGAGVLLLTFAPVFGASALATHAAFAAGALTVVVATGVVLVRTDVKGGLAWSTVAQMGFMTVQVAVGAFPAALFHIVGHGLYKAALFLGSGGAVLAHTRHRRRPVPQRPVPTPVRAAVAVVVPGLAIAAGYAVFDPHLPAAGHVLLGVFAWATGARAVGGWLRRCPLPRRWRRARSRWPSGR